MIRPLAALTRQEKNMKVIHRPDLDIDFPWCVVRDEKVMHFSKTAKFASEWIVAHDSEGRLKPNI